MTMPLAQGKLQDDIVCQILTDSDLNPFDLKHFWKTLKHHQASSPELSNPLVAEKTEIPKAF